MNPGVSDAADFMLAVGKSAGPTSRRIVDRLGRVLNRRDLGHAGTLDPFASGLLLVLAGRAAKLVPYIHEWDKEYDALIRLGESTDSLDSTGVVTAMSPVPPDVAGRIAAAASRLVGEIEQEPPMLSAVRSDGVRLYELARRGVKVDRIPRVRRVHQFEILSIDLPDVRARISCGSGTYIRSLAEALGKELGLPAHLAALNRTRIGPVRLDHALRDQDIENLNADDIRAAGVPLADILSDWPVVRLDDAQARDVTFGRIPSGMEIAEGDPGVRSLLLGPGGDLLALIERRSSPDGGARFLRVLTSAARDQ